MDPPVRIALAAIDDGRLLEALRALPLRAETHVRASLYDGIEALVALRPDVLFVGVGPDDGDLPGALRLLRGLLPGLGLVLVAPAALELQAAPLGERAAARLLLVPFTQGQLAAVLELALTGSNRPAADVFLDLAHGVADEVNNALLHLT